MNARKSESTTRRRGRHFEIEYYPFIFRLTVSWKLAAETWNNIANAFYQPTFYSNDEITLNEFNIKWSTTVVVNLNRVTVTVKKKPKISVDENTMPNNRLDKITCHHRNTRKSYPERQSVNSFLYFTAFLFHPGVTLNPSFAVP